MINLSITAKIVGAVLALAIIILIVVIVRLFKRRYQVGNQTLPDLDSLTKQEEDAKMENIKKIDPSAQFKEAMNFDGAEVEDDTSQYVSDNEMSTDFDDLISSPDERVAKKLAEKTKDVALPEIELSEQEKTKALPKLDQIKKGTV